MVGGNHFILSRDLDPNGYHGSVTGPNNKLGPNGFPLIKRGTIIIINSYMHKNKERFNHYWVEDSDISEYMGNNLICHIDFSIVSGPYIGVKMSLELHGKLEDWLRLVDDRTARILYGKANS